MHLPLTNSLRVLIVMVCFTIGALTITVWRQAQTIRELKHDAAHASAAVENKLAAPSDEVKRLRATHANAPIKPATGAGNPLVVPAVELSLLDSDDPCFVTLP